MTMSTSDTPFEKLRVAQHAHAQLEVDIANILGWGYDNILGIGYDTYDDSFEIYPMEDCQVVVTNEMHNAILALGCTRYWINFPDGTEQYGRAERKPSAFHRWNGFNEHWGEVRKVERRLQDAEQLIGKMEEALRLVDYIDECEDALAACEEYRRKG